MIVPRNRLLFATALLLPFLVVAPGSSLVFIAFLVLLAVFDALLSGRSLRGVRVILPDVVRLSKDSKGSFPVRIQNDVMKKRQVRIGIPFPPEISSEPESLTLMLPGETQFSSTEWSCVAEKRGLYTISESYLEASSPLGFWNARAKCSAHLEIRVYPNLLKDRKKLAALFLNKGDFGIHTRRMVGQGREFEKLREYAPGDSFDQIHWKATARRGRPVTKIFQIERTQEVYVVIDSSRLSAKEIGTETVLEYFLRSALILGLISQQQGDLFGVVTFSDKVDRFLRAGNGKAHYHACKDALYTLQHSAVTPDYHELCSFLRLRLRRRALLIVLTDLNDPILAESFAHSVELIASQHLVLVSMRRPEGARPLFSERDAETRDSLYRNLGGHLLWQNLRDVQKTLHLHGITLTQLEDASMSGQIVTQYLNVKKRQLL